MVESEIKKLKSFDTKQLSQITESNIDIIQFEMVKQGSPKKSLSNYVNSFTDQNNVIDSDFNDDISNELKLKKIEENYNNFIFICKFLPSIIATIIYLYSLKGCKGPFYICVITFERQYINDLMIPAILICSLLFYIQILIIKYNLNDRQSNKHRKYYLIPLLIYVALFLIDKGSTFDYHGFFNSVFLLIFTILFIMIEKTILNLFFFLKKYTAMLIGILVFISLIMFIVYYSYEDLIYSSCSQWDQGLGQSRINNTNSSCIITPPSICLMTMMSGYLNYSYWTNSTCPSMFKGSYEAVIEVIQDKNSKIIGFPRTNNWDWMRDSQRKYYNQKVRNEIINMEDPNIPDYIKDEIETIVNFKEQPAKVHIDLKFNKSLSEDRNKILSTEKGKKLFKNVLLFYTDSISRADYRRKLPNLHKWIDQYFRGVSNSTSHEAFQFFKYHGVGRYTLLNNLPSFWGTYSLQTKYGKYYIENFKKSGYVTGTAQNHCARETVPSDDIMEISFSGFDHELNGLYCDPNNESVNNTISQFHGANSMTPRCLYGKHTGEYGIEYTLQFWEKYKKNNKFFYLGFMDNHEATAEGISLLDYKFVDFLNEFKNRGFLQDTTIIFQSDHGHAYLSLYNIVKSQDHEKELVLPLLFYLIPRNYLNEEIRENLIWNEGSIISPFTVYNSYQAIIGYEKVQIAKHSKYNVFYDKIPRSDGCNQFYDKDYFKIAEYLCRCEGDTTGN